MASSKIRQAWVDRVPALVKRHRRGIDEWEDGVQIPVAGLRDAHLIITTLTEGGKDVGRQAEFYMRDGDAPQVMHMATFIYGLPPKWFGRRKLVSTTYHM